MIIVFSGFSGSGKSYTARNLSKHLKCPYLSSDKIRKELANISYTQKVFENFGEGIYSEQFTDKTYKELFKRAINLSKNNEYVIIDATFSNIKSQKMLMEKLDNYIFIFCHADENIIKQRLEQRKKHKVSISDGRWEIYLKQKENFKGLIIPEDRIIKLDTSKENYFDRLLKKIKIFQK